MSVDNVNTEWAIKLFRESLRTSHMPPFSGEVSIRANNNPFSELPTDPEKLQYLRDLITCILDGRSIVLTYNIALLIILLLFSLFHLGEVISQRSKWNILERETNTAAESRRSIVDNSEVVNESVSSSSSTLEGSLSSQTTLKASIADVERLQLLGERPREQKKLGNRLMRNLQYFLMYQPRPILILDRTLPSNGTSLFVSAFLCLNVFYHLYRIPFESKYFFPFADRAGLIFIVNLPILYLLAAKNQPLKLLTGRSYEALNIYHRRVGELMCFEALVHFGGLLYWRIFLSPEWLKVGSFSNFITHPVVLLGIGAFSSYELLYFTSLGSFRARWYELFLASHVVLQIAALVFLWLHFSISRPYVLASLAIFFIDRIVWRLWMKSAKFTVDLKILEDGRTLLLSADWDIPQARSQGYLRSLQRSIRHGWHPADHVFISVPALGPGQSLQAHPFTIASAAPSSGPSDSPNHAWLSLLIRVQSGFTTKLIDYAHSSSRAVVRLDGPYGSHDTLNMLRSCKEVVLIAGGSGIAVIFPLAWDLLTDHCGKRNVHLLWVTHSRTQRSWVPEERIIELREAGAHVTIPEPTAEAGRPDIPGYISELADDSVGQVGFVVSGPDGLNRTARNACAESARAGADIQLRVEKFGW
ncbi:hypothetical protein GGR52DRAFT_523041 [Hypoxylon sp. FL1284]|nr:hypothetical protein GGR52DRAFT_523041 [Hypoxylon sp. FL1284]